MPTNVEKYDAAIAVYEQGQVEAAVGKLQELVAEDDSYPLAHGALSVLLGKLDRHDEAVEHARRVCELEPDDPFSFIALSLLCQKAGRIPEAEQALMQARQAQYMTAARQAPAESEEKA